MRSPTSSQQVRRAVSLVETAEIDRAEFVRRIERARTAPPARLLVFTGAAGLGASALGIIWGLTEPVQVLMVAVAAVLGALLRRGAGRLGVGPVTQTFGAALLAGVAGTVAAAAEVPDPQKLIAVGPALILVPGPHLINGGFDISANRLGLGSCRILYALVTISAIAAGLLLGLALGGATLPVSSGAPRLPLPLDALCVAIAAASYAVFFAMPLRYVIIPAVVGAAAHALRSALMEALSMNLAVACGIGTLFAGVLVHPVARRLGIPFAGIGFASVVAFVPVTYLYAAVSGLVQLGRSSTGGSLELLDQVAFDGLTATLVLLALVLGLVLPFHGYHAIGRWRARKPS